MTANTNPQTQRTICQSAAVAGNLMRDLRAAGIAPKLTTTGSDSRRGTAVRFIVEWTPKGE